MSWEDVIKRKRVSDNERNIDPESFREYGMEPTYEKWKRKERSPELRSGADTFQQGIEKIANMFMKGKIDAKRYEELRNELREIFGED